MLKKEKKKKNGWGSLKEATKNDSIDHRNPAQPSRRGRGSRARSMALAIKTGSHGKLKGEGELLVDRKDVENVRRQKAKPSLWTIIGKAKTNRGEEKSGGKKESWDKRDRRR